LRDYAWGACILGCATSYRREVLQDIWPASAYAPGHDSWIQLAIYPARSAHIPEVLQAYRQHDANAVGFSVPVNAAEYSTREGQAISSNLAYLADLRHNSRLPFWKRQYFSAVYAYKRVRAALR
jgi:hypothetical protein